jgi:hypothetical protein
VKPPLAVTQAAQAFVHNGYRGPLHQAKLVFNWVIEAGNARAADPIAWRWAPEFIAAGHTGLRPDWQNMPPPPPLEREPGQIEFAYAELKL